ncbi:hypothetical protein FCV25MIE_00883, partial [Fagus crenata]
FRDDFERRKVMTGAPWLFDNSLLLLKEFDGSCPASQVQFSWCCFWVQFYGVPLFYMTKQTGEHVGSIFGKVEEVDVFENGVGWATYLRVRICLDITKPIPRGRVVTFNSLGQMWVSFKYERLPWLCFHCGLIGHLERDCVSRLKNASSSLGGVQQYGPCLQASELPSHRRGLEVCRSEQVRSGVGLNRGAQSGGKFNFELNRQTDFQEGESTNVRREVQNNEADTLEINPEISQMCEDKIGGSEKVLSPKMQVPQSHIDLVSNVQNIVDMHDIIATDKLDMVGASALHSNKVPVVPIIPHLPTQHNNSPRGDSVKTTLEGDTHVGPVVGSTNKVHPSGSGPGLGGTDVILEGKNGGKKENNNQKLGKKSWKRLAHEKGRGTSIRVTDPKREVEIGVLAQDFSGNKRVKVSDGICASEFSLLVEATTQPRRHQ